MENLRKTALLFLVLSACSGPEKKPEAILPLKVKTDSIITPDKDGVTVEKPELTEKDKIPPILLQKLTKMYAGWKFPEVSEMYLKKHDFTKIQGPNLVQGDFDGNKQTDFAVQIQHRDSIYIIAFLQKKDSLETHLLQRDQVYFLKENVPGSMYYLTFLAKNDTLFGNESGRKTNLTNDAVLIGLEHHRTANYFQGNKLKTISLED